WTMLHQLDMIRLDDSRDWDPTPIREAVMLLSSWSLLSIDGVKHHISMHPLVHTWARDRLTLAEQLKCWALSASTLAMSISWRYLSFDHQFRRLLLPHIDSCLNICSYELFLGS